MVGDDLAVGSQPLVVIVGLARHRLELSFVYLCSCFATSNHFCNRTVFTQSLELDRDRPGGALHQGAQVVLLGNA